MGLDLCFVTIMWQYVYASADMSQWKAVRLCCHFWTHTLDEKYQKLERILDRLNSVGLAVPI